MKIILDFGSGETCKNDRREVEAMLRRLSVADNGKHELIVKWQLFSEFGELLPLRRGLFAHAVDVARGYGYETTASVFDIESLWFLQQFNVPFVKIACIPDLYDDLMDSAGRIGYWETPLVVSVPDSQTFQEMKRKGCQPMCCVREYPATAGEYSRRFAPDELSAGISDHTTTGFLCSQYRPDLYEIHYCLPDQTGPDTKEFSRRPDDIVEILEGLQ